MTLVFSYFKGGMKTKGILKQDTKLKIKSVAYSSQGSHTGQLDFCNWLWQMPVRRDNVISITLRQV